MKIEQLQRFVGFYFFLCLFLSCTSVLAEESLRGPLPDEQKKNIHYLAQHHDELIREVTLRKDGYAATTTTSNKVLADKLKLHFRYMHRRVGRGGMVRRWDPAFVQLVEFHDQLTTEVQYLEDGISVIVVGKTPLAARVAQNHARIITEFREEGATAVHMRHAPVLSDDEPYKTHAEQDCED